MLVLALSVSQLFSMVSFRAEKEAYEHYHFACVAFYTLKPVTDFHEI
jgi:hypothetical protein